MCLSYVQKGFQLVVQKQNSLGAFVVLIALFIGFNSTSQTLYELQNEVDDAKLALWATEVYQDCPQYAGSEYIEIYRKQIDKIVITEVADLEDYYNLTNLSAVGLKNKCNYDLLLDTSLNFTIENFNPLKYFFDFYAPEDKLYLVDGTNFIITINN